MSSGKPTSAAEPDDLVDAPFLDDEERAESAWLLARESDPSAPVPSSKIVNDYTELEDLLGNLPSGPPDESWHDQVLKAASASQHRRRRPILRWGIGGAFAAAAAAAVVVMVVPHPPAPPELEVAIYHGDVKRGGGDAKRSDSKADLGDHLVVTARSALGDLRVYRSSGPLVGRCPGPACRASAQGEYSIDVSLDAPGEYRVILVVGMRDATPIGTIDEYIDAARVANARIVTYPPIEVR